MQKWWKIILFRRCTFFKPLKLKTISIAGYNSFERHQYICNFNVLGDDPKTTSLCNRGLKKSELSRFLRDKGGWEPQSTVVSSHSTFLPTVLWGSHPPSSLKNLESAGSWFRISLSSNRVCTQKCVALLFFLVTAYIIICPPISNFDNNGHKCTQPKAL